MNKFDLILKEENRRKKLAVGIIDDDQDAIDALAYFVELTDDFALVLSCTNAKEGLTLLRKLALDVLFLDIEMPQMNGLVFLAQLSEIKKVNKDVLNLQVVVCSAYEKFAFKTYDYKVADYLTKPVIWDRYLQSVTEVKQRLRTVSLNMLSESNECLLVSLRGGATLERLSFDDIIYAEAKDDRSWLWISATEYFDVSIPFKDVHNHLPKKNFVRVQRSFMVSLNHVKGMKGKEIMLRGTTQVIKRGEKGAFKTFEKWVQENLVFGVRKRFGVKREDKDDEKPENGDGENVGS